MHFSEYMHEWLYGADGYYASYRPIGKKGDFYTAVSTSKFFGGTIAKHIIARIDEGFLRPDSLICEIGAHHGYLLADIIEFIHTLRPQLLQTLRFGIVERFEQLREAQQTYFDESFGNAVRLEHYSDLSELDERCVFFLANEIFDAFGCELVYKGKIGRVENHKVIFDVESPETIALAQKYKQDRGEISVGYESFAEAMAKTSQRFEFMSFDYGELDARSDFSIRVYQNHQVFPLFDEGLNLAEAFGMCDITYDVNFTHVKEAFEAQGIASIQYATQLVALVEMGILELLAMLKEHASEEIYMQELEKVKILITPSLMGERFKMIRFVKG
ncbi:SAM-dependent methyltransferase [Sulfuricurvum sp.]|uniref:SAM-dependent methyltransferase n=1 Tax=Sulfuricurvum sp. TaxID=2025608 RepID=UPI00260DAACD|nr:SAM-dependent methyltransferase [Sulfuricurvum sp.]MDD2266210.1 SAM-dependent methyltransferase [Sulfuricurvum sp.]MDD2783144.1 SAM-dependent methyltransferase [Sulfuricurvum sp.]